MAIWTPAELSSELRPWEGRCWRLVEAQHVVSTLKLVDSMPEQDLLESLLEETKPLVPPECAHLHYLLFTPFRYEPPYPQGSRFRRAGRTPGVFYAAEGDIGPAVAETAFYRLLFFAESPQTPWPDNAAEFTAFSAAVSARSIDLTLPPLDRDAAQWMDLQDYAACQQLADTARAVDAGVIRYRSVRDPAGGFNVAVLTGAAFSHPEPLERQTWRMRFSAAGVQAICEFPVRRREFGRDAFAADPRLDQMLWDRTAK